MHIRLALMSICNRFFLMYFGQLSLLLSQISCENCKMVSISKNNIRKFLLFCSFDRMTIWLLTCTSLHYYLFIIARVHTRVCKKIAANWHTMANKIESYKIIIWFSNGKRYFDFQDDDFMEERKKKQKKRFTWTFFTEIKWRKKNVKQQLYFSIKWWLESR